MSVSKEAVGWLSVEACCVVKQAGRHSALCYLASESDKDTIRSARFPIQKILGSAHRNGLDPIQTNLDRARSTADDIANAGAGIPRTIESKTSRCEENEITGRQTYSPGGNNSLGGEHIDVERRNQCVGRERFAFGRGESRFSQR
jgi:hypothetical protein